MLNTDEGKRVCVQHDEYPSRRVYGLVVERPLVCVAGVVDFFTR